MITLTIAKVQLKKLESISFYVWENYDFHKQFTRIKNNYEMQNVIQKTFFLKMEAY